MILERLLGRPRTERLARKIPGQSISQTPGVLYMGRQSSAGVSVSEDDALSLSAVFAGVQLLSSIIGALPLSVYRKSGSRRDVADELPQQRMLHSQLNPEMTASIGRRTMEFHRLLWGNEYAEIGWLGGGTAQYLYPIEPWRVRPDRDKDTDKLGYWVDGTRWVSARDMVHVPLISADGVCGQSFVDYAVESLGLGLASQEFSARFFGNGAQHGGLLVHAGSPSEPARREFQKSWTEKHGGTENAGKVGVMWGGWSWQAGGGVDPDKAQLLEQRRFQVEEVARWLNIPPHLLRDLSRATFSNIEHQGIDFVTYSLNPPLVNKEQEYDRKLLNPPTLYCKHNLAGLLRGDSVARANFYKTLFALGVVSPNDIRELEDMNPIANGDTYFVPANMQTLERALNPPPTPAPFGATNPDDEEDPDEDLPPDPIGPNTPGIGDAGMSAKLRPVLVETFQRLAKKEANEARRAARKPDAFFNWMDAFYKRHELTLTAALSPTAGTSAALLASRWCEQSKAKLLDITGAAKPQELYGLIDIQLNQWAIDRAEEMTEHALTEVMTSATI